MGRHRETERDGETYRDRKRRGDIEKQKERGDIEKQKETGRHRETERDGET